jgi:hypothetical protein
MRDIVVILVIVSFTTKADGWRVIAKGNLLNTPKGHEKKVGHSVLIEGHDFHESCTICKNSQSGQLAMSRFSPKFCPIHDCQYVAAYFTRDSIRGKATRRFVPPIEKFPATLDESQINAACVQELSATDCSEWACEPPARRTEYIDYETDEWIQIMQRVG